MFNLSSNAIAAIENVEEFDADLIEAAKKNGFCYIKIPNETSFTQHHLSILSKSRDLFNSPDNVKKTYSQPTDQVSAALSGGYTDSRNKPPIYAESFRSEVGDKIAPPLDSCEHALRGYKAILIDQLALKVANKMLDSLHSQKNQPENIVNILSNLRSDLRILYYSRHKFSKYFPFGSQVIPRLIPHKDSDLFTVIVSEEPGLKYWINGVWQDIFPKQGYAIMLFGHYLELISHGKINPCLHVVEMSKEQERISIILFVSIPAKILAENNLPSFAEVFSHNNTFVIDSTESAFFNFTLIMNALLFSCVNFLLTKKSPFIKEDYSIFNQSMAVNYIVINIVTLALLNLGIRIFRNTHFDRMFTDYLRYPVCPESASTTEKSVYKLGQSSFGFSAAGESFLTASTYTHASFWNAGFMKSFNRKFSTYVSSTKKP